MSTTELSVRNAEWAERVFPARLKEAAKKRLGYNEGDKESKLVTRTYEILTTTLDVSRPTVSRWLSGDSFPRIEHILAIADCLEVDPDFLVGNTDADQAGFSLAALEARIPYDRVLQVLRIMSEIRGKDEIPDDRFAEAGVKMLQMVERDPDMSEDALIGAAYRMLKGSQ